MPDSAKAKPAPFEWDDLARYKTEKRFLDGYPPDQRTFYSPRDEVRPLLASLLSSAQRSIVLNMFGYADPELDAIIRRKLEEEHVYVQMSLDSSQAGGKTEKPLVEEWLNGEFGNSIAVGTSSEGHAYSHLKILIVDNVYTVTGSTNWSVSGQSEQDNQLTLNRNAVIAAETRGVLDLNHDWMLKQMAERREKEAKKAAKGKD
jgi:phosphatidylserine/phosphatidylglycerophosphate/cardiolipin synthase-like enzyme